jgi:hypothetical protein
MTSMSRGLSVWPVGRIKYKQALLLLEHVGFVLVIEKLDNWHPRVAIVHVISETGRIDDGQSNCVTSQQGQRRTRQTFANL